MAVLAVSVVPAAAAESVEYTVTVRDDGFSQATIDAHAGDFLVFRLDEFATQNHTLAWDHGQVTFPFSRDHMSKRYGPLNAGTLHFYDADQVSGYEAGGPFTGVLTVTKASSPSPTDTSPSTTATTAPSPVSTTTAPAPTTTTTSATIRPFLISDPGPTTTTTAARPSGGAASPPAKNSPSTTTTGKEPNKDKAKGKAAGAETATTAPPVAAATPSEAIFDPASLTPSPTSVPDAPAANAPGDEAALDTASVLSLLDAEKPADTHDRTLLYIVLGALVILALTGGAWGWLNRASRYDPA